MGTTTNGLPCGTARSSFLSSEARRARRRPSASGFTLIEIIIALSLFVLFSIAILSAYGALFRSSNSARTRVAALAVGQERMEQMKNFSFADLGTDEGFPKGVIPAEETVERDGMQFTARTIIRVVDDPFDGTFDGTPRDDAPVDYKAVFVTVGCVTCFVPIQPLQFSSIITKTGFETAGDTGALFIRVLNANGEAVVGATARVVNEAEEPDLVITETTDGDGLVRLYDLPLGDQRYEITVSKAGYSSERTYAPLDPENPSPLKPHATVLLGEATMMSFAIDRVGSLALKTQNEDCTARGGASLHIEGEKLIGNPNVKKVSRDIVMGADGTLALSDMEWDVYDFIVPDLSLDIAGAVSGLPLTMDPAMDASLSLLLAPRTDHSLLALIRDGTTGNPLQNVTVRVTNTSGYDQTITTDVDAATQADWSGGAGQERVGDATRYFEDDGNVSTTASPGSVQLKLEGGGFVASGTLTSSTFDLGSGAGPIALRWDPPLQPEGMVAESVRLQIATNDDELSWTFVGPDGTQGSFYTTSGTAIPESHRADRYARYKLFLQTADPAVTPVVTGVTIDSTRACAPPGQAFFSGLGAGEYTVEISRPGYRTAMEVISVAGATRYAFPLLPE